MTRASATTVQISPNVKESHIANQQKKIKIAKFVAWGGLSGAVLSGILAMLPIGATAQAVFVGILGLCFYVALIAWFTYVALKRRLEEDRRLEDRMREIVHEREQVEARIAARDKEDIFDRIDLSLSQLKEYHVLNLAQARNSFWVSMTVAGFGILLLASAVGVYLKYAIVPLAAIAAVGGVVTQFIGATYLVIYRRALGQIDYFYSELIRMQDTMLAIKLAEGLTDGLKHAEMKQKIIEALLARRSATN